MALVNVAQTFQARNIGARVARAAAPYFDARGAQPWVGRIIEQYLAQTCPYFTPYDHHPQTKGRADVEPCALFVPDRLDYQTGRRTYLLYRQDALGQVDVRHYPFIPNAASFLKDSFQKEAVKRGVVDRAPDDITNHMLLLLMRGIWDNPERVLGRKANKSYGDMRDLFLQDGLSEGAGRACMQTGRIIASVIATAAVTPSLMEKLDAHKDKSPSIRQIGLLADAFSGHPDVMAVAKETADLEGKITQILMSYEEGLLRDPRQEFVQHLDADACNVLAGVPGRQTSQIYNTLVPFAQVPQIDASGNRTGVKGYELDSTAATIRRTALKAFPLIASLPSARTALKWQDAPEGVMAHALGISPKMPEAVVVVNFLAGKTEADVPAEVAASLSQTARGLLHIPDPDLFPQDAEEWGIFHHVTRMDETLYSLRLVNQRGAFMEEFAGHLQDGRSWGATFALYGGTGGGSKIEQMRRFETLSGIGAIGPTVLRLAETWEEANFVKDLGPRKDLLALCRVVDKPYQKGLKGPARDMMNANSGVSLSGAVFNDFPVMERMAGAQAFLARNSDVEKWRSHLVMMDYMASYGLQARWQGLPQIQDEERRRAEMPLIPTAIETAKDLMLLGWQMQSTPYELMDRVISGRAHFCKISRPGTGQLVGITMLRDVNEEGQPLQLEHVRTWGPFNETYGLPNSVPQTVEGIVRIMNRRALDAESFEAAREKLRAQVDRHATAEMIVGHDWRNPQQNAEFVDMMRPYWPAGLVNMMDEQPEEIRPYGALALPVIAQTLRGMLQGAGYLRNTPGAVLVPYGGKFDSPHNDGDLPYLRLV